MLVRGSALVSSNTSLTVLLGTRWKSKGHPCYPMVRSTEVRLMGAGPRFGATKTIHQLIGPYQLHVLQRGG